MKRTIFVVLGVALLVGAAFGQQDVKGQIWFNDGTTGTTLNLLAVSSGVDNTAVNAGSAPVGIIGVCVAGCGTTGASVIANGGDIFCSFTGTAIDGHFVQAAGSGSQCVDGGATYPTTGGAVVGVVKKGGTGAGVYLVSWSYSLSNPSTGGGMVWPVGAAGIPNYTGSSAWGTSYSASNQIPATFVSTLNQSTTGNAATATALATTPTLCTTGQAPTGVLANGNATGCAAVGGGGAPGGVSGDIQKNNGSGGFAAAAMNDNGTTISTTEPISVGGSSHYIDVPEQATPANPAATTERWYANSTTHLLSCLTSSGGSCAPTGNSSTRTWLFPFQGTTQGGVVGVSLNLPISNAMVIVPSDSTHINPRWKTTGGNTSLWYWVKLRVPTGHTGAYTATVTFNAVATTGAANLEIYTACVAPGAVDPGESSFADSTVGIPLTPAGTTLQNVTASNTFTPTCADGSDLYVKFIPSTNTIGAGDINFSYTSLAVTANN